MKMPILRRLIEPLGRQSIRSSFMSVVLVTLILGKRCQSGWQVMWDLSLSSSLCLSTVYHDVVVVRVKARVRGFASYCVPMLCSERGPQWGSSQQLLPRSVVVSNVVYLEREVTLWVVCVLLRWHWKSEACLYRIVVFNLCEIFLPDK
jgi:hypothetical protein